MVQVRVEYLGDLRCRLTHGPSGTEILTDAPKDNQGRGEFFSPTDLVAAALGSCMITLMAIVARRHEIDLSGLSASVDKEMVADPDRRVGKLTVTIHFTRNYSDREKVLLERAAMTCPVHKSIGRDVEIPVKFHYPD